MSRFPRRIVAPITSLVVLSVLIGSLFIRLDTATSVFASSSTSIGGASSCIQSAANYYAGYTPQAIAYGDVNGDGKLDLAVANRDLGSVSILPGTGTGAFQSPTSFTVGYAPYSVALRDLNGDGELDLVAANKGSNTVSVLLGTGTGSFTSVGQYSVGNIPMWVTVGDVNKDGKPDLLTANSGSNNVSVLLGTGTGSFNTAVNYAAGTTTSGVAVGDVNNDGNLDAVAANMGSNNVSVLLGTGTGSFNTAVNYATGAGAGFVVLGDLNGDGILDATTSNGASYTVSVLLGTGSGGFVAGVNYAVGSNPQGLALGDVNGDGTLDVAVANWYSNSASVLLGNGDGTLQAATHYTAGGGQVNSATLADLNADSQLDLVVANYTYQTVTVMLGQPPDLTPPTGSIAINQGAGATASPKVSLNLAAQDVGCGVATMAFSNDGTSFTSFEPYASTKAWTLPDGDGSKTVFVKFKDRADNVSEPVSATIILDQSAPTGSLTINDGAGYTTNRSVMLALNASDSGTGVKQMYLSDGVNGSGWISYATSAAWTLPAGDGSKTVTARFRDAAGNVSALATATIVLDTSLPSVTIGPLSTYQVQTTFQVTIVGTDTTSGVSSYDLEFRDGSNGAWTGWLIGTTATTASFTGQDGHTYSFRVRARDQAGNVSSYSAGDARTTVDVTAPASDRFLINFGALETTAVNVSLSVGATDATSGVAAMSFSNDGASWSAWQPYAPVALWSLSPGDGVKTVYGRFSDAAGNISAVTSDTIVLNTFVATDYGLTINDGALFTNQTTVTLTIGAYPGTTQMQVSNDGGFAGVSWEPYASHKTWQISQYGTYVLPRVVYVRYKDQNGTISSTYQDDIVLDITPPSGEIAIVRLSGAQISASAAVTLQFNASDDVSGIGAMRVSRRSDFSEANWQPYASSLAWNLGEHETVYVQFRDNAGNISRTYTAALQQQIYLPIVVW